MQALITNNTIKIAGVGYFVLDAPRISFGGWGRKVTPAVGKNGLDQVGVLAAAKLAGVKLQVAALEVEFSGSVGAELFAGIKLPGLVKGGAKIGVGTFRDGLVKLLMVSPRSDQELIRAFNDAPAALRGLIDIDGGRARVVETALIAVEAEMHTRFMGGASVKGAAMVDGVMLEAEASGGVSRETRVNAGPGTCLGYALAEPQWDATLDRNKTRITGLRPDRHGL